MTRACETAAPLVGWHAVNDGLPPVGATVAIVHFGDDPDMRIYDTAIVDQYGLCPLAADGGHGKRSTVTHWRYLLDEGPHDDDRIGVLGGRDD